MIKLFFILIVHTIAGCGGGTKASTELTNNAPVSNAANIPVPTLVELQYDQITNHQDLKLRWLNLEDSRCPIGVTCVWAGQIQVTLLVAKNGEKALEIELQRRPGRAPTTAHVFGYELRLQDVSPHPKKNITPDREAYRLQFEISR